MKRDGLRVLNDLRVASPCDAEWADMRGDDRKRFCGQCEKNVYDLTVMSPEEIVVTIEAAEGKLCGRLYQRADGRVLTGDCPVGVARLLRKAKRRGYLAVAWAIGLAASAASVLIYGERRSGEIFGPETNVTRVIEHIETITPPEPDPREIMMGDLVEAPPLELGEIEAPPPPR